MLVQPRLCFPGQYLFFVHMTLLSKIGQSDARARTRPAKHLCIDICCGHKFRECVEVMIVNRNRTAYFLALRILYVTVIN